MFEMFSLEFMLHAFLACCILGFLLSYLGIHVVGRGIVFVDLALGQISSLGVAIAEFVHYGEWWLPIVFTVLGAVLLSLIHIHDRRLRLEAVIGIVYVVASAVTVLIIAKTPHGEANIQEVLFGILLGVTGDDLRNLLYVFGVIGILHIIFYKAINTITVKMEAGESGNFSLKERGLNFFFYMSIGLAIVFAVRIGGVLPVFAFLVVPAVSAVLLARNKVVILILAVGISVLASYFGLLFAYTLDFPTGPSVVAMFGAIFLLASGARFIRKKVFKISFEEEQ
ncbi:MAG: metal ABC transporter permease [Bacteroidetes bacterium]|nr:metal ABC transporter permease [Bacteroidota bacterium]